MKPKQKSMVQNITSANCVFQRQVLPSRGYGSPMPPTFTEPFSQRVAYRWGAAQRNRPGNPSPSLPPRPPHRSVGYASATCPPPAARPPAIGWRRCPSRREGASPASRRSHWLWRRRSRPGARPRRGGEPGGAGGGSGTGGGCRFRNRRSDSRAARPGSGRAVRGRWEWRPLGGGRVGGAGKEAAGGLREEEEAAAPPAARVGAAPARGDPARPWAAGLPGRPRAARGAGGGPAWRVMQPAGNTRRGR